MKKLLLALIITAIVASSTYAAMCFKKGEVISGLNKICYYDCLGSTYAITVKSYELCPLSINN